MPKLSDVGLGGYIRSHRNSKEVLKVEVDDGNTFRCHPIKEIHGTRVVLDLERYFNLPKDQEVDRVTI